MDRDRSSIKPGMIMEGGEVPVDTLKWTERSTPPARGALMTGGEYPAQLPARPSPPITYGLPLSTLREIEERQAAVAALLASLQKTLKRA